MPLALLLHQTFTVFRKGTEALAPWNQLVALEQILVDRVRGAFLVHWFGPGLPLYGLSLRIAIENLEELRQRYAAVRAATTPDASGLNLTEPLAGIGGSLVGILISPTGGLLLWSAAMTRLPKWLMWLGLTLGQVIGLIPTALLSTLGPVAGIIALPLALVGAVLFGGLNARDLRAVYDLLGAVANLLVSLRTFLEQLLGPREKIRNPLLRQVLEVFDKLAGLVPFLLAFIAFLVTRVGVLIAPLMQQARALMGLISAVVETVQYIIKDLSNQWDALFANEKDVEFVGYFGPLGFVTIVIFGFQGAFVVILKRTLGAILSSMEALKKTLKELPERLFQSIDAGRTQATIQFNAWKMEVTEIISDAILLSPLVKHFQALRKEIDVFRSALSRGKPGSGSKSSGGMGSLIAKVRAIAALLPSSGPSMPGPPKLPDPADIARRAGKPLIDLTGENLKGLAQLVVIPIDLFSPPPYGLSADAYKALQKMEQPRNIFAEERRELKPAETLAAARAAEMPLRELLVEIVDRILPPAAAAYLPRLNELFQTLDKNLYHADPETITPLPVKALPESERLLPIVRHLRIRAAGADEAATRAWSARLQAALQAQTYTAPAGS